MSGLDIVEEHGDGRFQLTPRGEELRLDRLGGLAGFIVHWAAGQHYDFPACAESPTSVEVTAPC